MCIATYCRHLGMLVTHLPCHHRRLDPAAGLDSATTFTVIKYLGSVARTLESTMVISLLQPSGDVLSLFDDVMLLAEG